MLRHLLPCAGNNETGNSGDIKSVSAITTRSNYVQQIYRAEINLH
jgi:hypothetical protein